VRHWTIRGGRCWEGCRLKRRNEEFKNEEFKKIAAADTQKRKIAETKNRRNEEFKNEELKKRKIAETKNLRTKNLRNEELKKRRIAETKNLRTKNRRIRLGYSSFLRFFILITGGTDKLNGRP
jgi:hypothetical protein